MHSIKSLDKSSIPVFGGSKRKHNPNQGSLDFFNQLPPDTFEITAKSGTEIGLSNAGKAAGLSQTQNQIEILKENIKKFLDGEGKVLVSGYYKSNKIQSRREKSLKYILDPDNILKYADLDSKITEQQKIIMRDKIIATNWPYKVDIDRAVANEVFLTELLKRLKANDDPLKIDVILALGNIKVPNDAAIRKRCISNALFKEIIGDKKDLVSILKKNSTDVRLPEWGYIKSQSLYALSKFLKENSIWNSKMVKALKSYNEHLTTIKTHFPIVDAAKIENVQKIIEGYIKSGLRPIKTKIW